MHHQARFLTHEGAETYLPIVGFQASAVAETYWEPQLPHGRQRKTTRQVTWSPTQENPGLPAPRSKHLTLLRPPRRARGLSGVCCLNLMPSFPVPNWDLHQSTPLTRESIPVHWQATPDSSLQISGRERRFTSPATQTWKKAFTHSCQGAMDSFPMRCWSFQWTPHSLAQDPCARQVVAPVFPQIAFPKTEATSSRGTPQMPSTSPQIRFIRDTRYSYPSNLRREWNTKSRQGINSLNLPPSVLV